MTLRLRLVLAMVVLVTAGLSLFGVTTYSLYSSSEYGQLSAQLRNSEPDVTAFLQQLAGSPGGNGGAPPGGPGPLPGSGQGGAPPVALPQFGVLYSSDGEALSHLPVYSSSESRPKLPSGFLGPQYQDRVFPAPSVSGSTAWRVFVFSVPGPSGDEIAVGVPTTSVTAALAHLVRIELGGGLALLVTLSLGALVILSRGLRPIENMASTARAISAGDLTQRARQVGGGSEVAQLGLALNAMLSDIEAAFAERDATELRLRQFLADASHELRTPLTSIQGFAELARLERTSSAPAAAGLKGGVALERIEEQAARMGSLVEELLLLARMDKALPISRDPVDLTVLAADACSEAAALTPSRPIALSAPESVVVLGDETHLRQAITNLVTNAIKHTPGSSPIEVSSLGSRSEAIVRVRDHGQGLDAEGLAHAFDRFWRSDTARASVGTGLGLSIAAAVAAEHGGRVEVENAPDGGAVFTLTLPLADD